MPGTTVEKDIKDRIYKNYTSVMPWKVDISKKVLDRWNQYYRAHYKKFLSANKKSKILDIGCGYGRMLHFLKNQSYSNTYGIDISRQQIDLAHKLGFDQTLCIQAIDFLADNMNQFDTIFMLDILEHIEKSEIIELMDRVYTALRPNGNIILQLPNSLTPLNVYRHVDFTHEMAFTVSSIKQILSITGFENTKTYPLAPHMNGPVSLLMSLMWHIIWQNLIRFYMFTANGNLMGDIYTANFIAVAEKGKDQK